jgi:hypothetical protein
VRRNASRGIGRGRGGGSGGGGGSVERGGSGRVVAVHDEGRGAGSGVLHAVVWKKIIFKKITTLFIVL